MSSGIDVKGGAGGTVACIEDLEAMAHYLNQVADDFATAARAMDQLDASVADGTVPGESTTLIQVRGRLREEIRQAQNPNASARRCMNKARLLAKDVAEVIEAYEDAEERARRRFNLLEVAEMFGYDMRGLLPGARTVNCLMMLNSLLSKAAVRLRRGKPLASTLRRYYPLVREFLSQALNPLPSRLGTPNARSLAGLLAYVGRFINGAMGLGKAKVAKVATWKEAIATSNLADLVAGVDKADELTKSGQPSILVSKVTGPNGETSWIVSIPPTAQMVGGKNPFDVVSDVETMGLDSGDMVTGVLKALKAAGVGSRDQILMIGHSLGGLTAAAVVSSAEFQKRYAPPAIITMGSPIAPIPIPANVRVLALEHTEDTLVALGGTTPRTSNITTVTRSLAKSPLKAERAASTHVWGTKSHARPYYQNTLEMVDNSTDPSLLAFKQHVSGILVPGSEVTTTQYGIMRPPAGK
jgi:hypothetical protein